MNISNHETPQDHNPPSKKIGQSAIPQPELQTQLSSRAPVPPLNCAEPGTPFHGTAALTIKPKGVDEVFWQAPDGQVSLVIKTRPRRWPQSNYPVLVVVLRQKAHTRIQPLDGRDGTEALFTYEEIEKLVEGANRIAVQTGKGPLFEILQRVPPKDPARKAMWDRIKAAHHKRKRLDRRKASGL